ncbi:MAG TPA: hypothetical protein VE645_19065 [Pseudonocardiaceae bacterium]|jgi:hypothetical protein|nr:hypothetical protein [Pseudonocardiaceae bacterium]
MALKDQMQDRTWLVRAERCRKQEAHRMAIRDNEALIDEIDTLHEFIADVRRGIRDLSEYEEVCRRAGLAIPAGAW